MGYFVGKGKDGFLRLPEFCLAGLICYFGEGAYAPPRCPVKLELIIHCKAVGHHEAFHFQFGINGAFWNKTLGH